MNVWYRIVNLTSNVSVILLGVFMVMKTLFQFSLKNLAQDRELNKHNLQFAVKSVYIHEDPVPILLLL